MNESPLFLSQRMQDANYDDAILKQIIAAASAETGISESEFVPAITFEDNPDEKIYLLLLTMFQEGDGYDDYYYKEWSIKKGRQATYDYLKELILNDSVDPNTSFVVVGSMKQIPDRKDDVALDSKPITVFRFMKIMADEKRVLESGDFDIDEYGSYSEDGDKTILEI